MRKIFVLFVLAALVAVALPSAPTSASTYNYLVFTSNSLDCTAGTASGTIVYSLQPGAKVVSDVDVNGAATLHTEYVATTNKSGTKTDTWANAVAAAGAPGTPFPNPGYAHVTVKVYDPDGTLASETEAYGECPSGTAWVKGWGMPGADDFIEYTPWTVGGTLVRDAMLYAMPGQPVVPEIILPAGKNVLVLGMDASGQYYKIVFAASYLWVEADAVGPNYDAVWGGAPLPTQVVN